MNNTDTITDIKNSFELIRHMDIGILVNGEIIDMNTEFLNYIESTEDCNKKEG